MALCVRWHSMSDVTLRLPLGSQHGRNCRNKQSEAEAAPLQPQVRALSDNRVMVCGCNARCHAACSACTERMQDVSDRLLRERDFHLLFRKWNQEKLQNCNFLSATACGFHYAASRGTADSSGWMLADGCIVSSLFSKQTTFNHEHYGTLSAEEMGIKINDTTPCEWLK